MPTADTYTAASSVEELSAQTAVVTIGDATEPTAQFDSGSDDYIAAVNRTMAAREIERQNQMIIQFVMAAVTSGALQ